MILRILKVRTHLNTLPFLPSPQSRKLSGLSLEGLRLVEERARVRVCGFSYELLINEVNQ